MKISFYSYKGGRGWSFWQLIRESLLYSSEQNIDHLIQDVILHPSKNPLQVYFFNDYECIEQLKPLGESN